jgi:hypothetical protein
MRRITVLLLCSVGLWSSVAAARYLGPTAQGYSFHASALPDCRTRGQRHPGTAGRRVAYT